MKSLLRNITFSTFRAHWYAQYGIFVILLASGGTNLHAIEPIIIEAVRGKYTVGLHSEVLEDPDQKLGWPEVSERTEWTPNQDEVPNFGLSDSAHWLRFKVRNPSDQERFLVLEQGNPLIDFIDVFIKNESGDLHYSTGDRRPFESRPKKHRNFLFDVVLPPNGTTEIYIRSLTQNTTAMPLVLWDRETFTAQDDLKQYFLGFLLGILFVMAFYNFFIFLSLRDASYLYYVLFLLGLTAWVAMYEGLTFLVGWPDSPRWSNRIFDFTNTLYVFLFVLFTRAYLQTRKNTPFLDRLHVILAGIFIFVMILSLTDSHSISVLFLMLGGLAGVFIFTAAATICMRRGQRSAGYYLLAFFVEFVTGILISMKTSGVLPSNFITEDGIFIGFVFMSILLSLGLADRINVMREERERAQQESLKAQGQVNSELQRAHRLKDEFLSNTSHELRTPLNGIIGIAESLMDGATGRINKGTKYNLRMIVSSGKRLASLIDDILDFSKLRNSDIQLSPRPVDVGSVINLVLALSMPLVRSRDLELVRELPEDLPAAWADENRLQQILHNLIGNAIKFTQSGHIAVRVTVNDDHMLEIAVEDTGIGIPREKRERIFKSFEQGDASIEREYGGTGLGLAISRKLVELHGGILSVRSEPDRGSCFSFTIPVSREAIPAPEEDVGREPIRTTSADFIGEGPVSASWKVRSKHPGATLVNGVPTVLIVDDEPVNRQVLTNLLGINNYRVREAVDGESALRMIDKERPQLVLLDVMMPRMNGYEVCRRIRRKHSLSDLPVIILTAKNQVSNLLEGMESGASDYVPKPFNRNELLARMRTHLNLLRINEAYGRFIPGEFLKNLGKESIVDVRLGDQVKREMNILFSDIRDFTSLSEKMTPEENFAFVNGILSKTGPIIRQHGGFIDKYIGDAVMALFPSKADDAVDAAIDMLAALGEINKSREARGEAPIFAGTGIHRGQMMLGTVGEEQRMDSTVISDAVNLAARLESLSKTYGASIVISQHVLRNLPDPSKYWYRFLDQVTVKGKQEPVSVFEIFSGDPEEVFLAKLDTRDDFERSIQAFHAGDYREAAAKFGRVVRAFPGDKAAQHYERRAMEYILNPPRAVENKIGEP